MLLGVLADSHDNLPMIDRAARLFERRGVEFILHAGDFVAPFALKALTRPGIPVIGVFGNNDGERRGLKEVCDTLYDPPHSFALGGAAIVLSHALGAVAGEPTADAGLIVHGHTHRHSVKQGPPLVLNPGEAGGWLTGMCTAAIVDLDRMAAELVNLGTQETILT